MRAVVQRVKMAKVVAAGKTVGLIGRGLLVLLAIKKDDPEADTKLGRAMAEKMANKIVDLRIFSDSQGKMNKSVQDINGKVMLVSQFTLYGNCGKGNRPSFMDSAKPSQALLMYEKIVKNIKGKGISCETGEFGADMQLELINDGPVTLIINI